MARGEKIFLSIMFLFAIFLFITASQLMKPMGADYIMGPDVWPKIMAFGIIFFTAILLIKNWKKRPIEQQSSKEENVEKRSKSRMIAVLLVSFLYIYGMNQLGFLIATPLFVAAILYLMQYRRIRPFVIFPLLLTVIFFVIFIKVAEIPLPRGHWIFRNFNLIFY